MQLGAINRERSPRPRLRTHHKEATTSFNTALSGQIQIGKMKDPNEQSLPSTSKTRSLIDFVPHYYLATSSNSQVSTPNDLASSPVELMAVRELHLPGLRADISSLPTQR
jgi:hypothetical protein